jgi:hypothetical protein
MAASLMSYKNYSIEYGTERGVAELGSPGSASPTANTYNYIHSSSLHYVPYHLYILYHTLQLPHNQSIVHRILAPVLRQSY